MTLLIDVGNTRVKWARRRGETIGAKRSAPLEGDGGALFRRVLSGIADDEPVWVVNVAGLRVERALRRAARATGRAVPEFARSERSAAGVRNGYAEPWRLGADRWIAMLGARRLLAEAPVCVVDVGTALTLDVVDARGTHRGGLIVPGPDLMVSSLLRGTRGIRRRATGAAAAPSSAGSPWGRTTLAALERGAIESCAGVIERGFAEARRRFGPRTRLLVTGGAAPSLRRALPRGARLVPALVLEGLVAWGTDRGPV